MPVVGIDGSVADADENLVFGGSGYLNFRQLQDIGRPVAVIDDCLHRLHPVPKQCTRRRAKRFRENEASSLPELGAGDRCGWEKQTTICRKQNFPE